MVNFDADKGVHYGVVALNDLNEWAMEDIYQNGDDLDYAEAVDEFKASLLTVGEKIVAICNDKGNLFYRGELIASAIDEGCDLLAPGESDDIWDQLCDFPEVIERGAQAIADWLWSELEDDFNETYSSSCCEPSRYSYDDGEVKLLLCSDGDIFITKSPVIAHRGLCSPCAPNAGHLNTDGCHPTYSLPDKWWPDSKCPHELSPVSRGQRRRVMEDTFIVGNLTVRIEQDLDACDPRKEFDNFGVMACSHRRYELGDEQLNEGSFEGWDDVEQYLLVHRGAAVILPLYLYDHSGLTISTTPFSCRWDSGQIGFIFATKERLAEKCGGDIESAKRILRGEVETYDQYLTGNVYGYVIEDEDGTLIDSCWGFYGYDDCKVEAIALAESESERIKTEELNREMEVCR